MGQSWLSATGADGGVSDPRQLVDREALGSAQQLVAELRGDGGRPARRLVLEAYCLIATRSKEDAEQACERLAEAAAEDPESVPVLLALATGFLSLKQAPKARNQLKRIAKMPRYAAEDWEEFEKAWLMLAELQLAAGKHDQAQEMAKRCLLYNKSSGRAYELLGQMNEREQVRTGDPHSEMEGPLRWISRGSVREERFEASTRDECADCVACRRRLDFAFFALRRATRTQRTTTRRRGSSTRRARLRSVRPHRNLSRSHCRRSDLLGIQRLAGPHWPLPVLRAGYRLAFNFLKAKRFVEAIDVRCAAAGCCLSQMSIAPATKKNAHACVRTLCRQKRVQAVCACAL